MKFKDHKNMSCYLAASMNRRIKARNRWALIVGSVIPDIAVFTYLRGSLSGEKLKGHNYENTSHIIGSLIDNIYRNRKYGVRRYFEIGKLLHYSADSFTYAHNSSFTGTISEHRAYEMELHERLDEAMRSGEEDEALELEIHNDDGFYKNAADMNEKLKRLHNDYSALIPDSQNDCRYIMYVLGYLYGSLAVEKTAGDMRNAA